MDSSLRDASQHHRPGSLGLGVSSPGPTDEIVVALANWGSGSPPSREELVRALAAAAEGIKGSSGKEAGAAVIPMDVEMEGEDELDRPSSARLSDAGAQNWVLRCRLVNNMVSVLDQLAASHTVHAGSSPQLLGSVRRRSSSGASSRAATVMPFTPNCTGGGSTPGGRRRDSSLGGKEVNVSLDISADGKEELLRLKQENEMLRHRLAEVEGNWRKAVDNAKALQTAQQRLFQDLVLLREKYDDAKAHIAEVLWSYLPAESRFCPSIPPLGRGLFESEKRVGDWDLGEKLGEGQFAKVFACRHSSGSRKDKEYALKVINKDKINSLAALKRVDSEVGAQRTLRHRGILQVREVLNGRYGLYVVMEMGGKDLFDFVEEQQQRQQEQQKKDEEETADAASGIVVSEANCRVLARNLVDAIAFCHANHIAHRDLKPENILLGCPRGKSVADPNDPALFEAKICDFGLCSSFTPGEPLTDFCGSPGFFAPEMITAGSYDGPAADIWSLGCILLELSVGHDLFCDEWMQAYDYDLMQDAPRFEARLQECRAAIEAVMREKLRLNEHLVDFILGLLTLDPARRLTVPQIVAHPWITLNEGGQQQSLLTGILPPSPKEVEAPQEQEQGKGQGRAETPLPAVTSKRPGPLLSLKGGIPEEAAAEGMDDAPPLEEEMEGAEVEGSDSDGSDAMRGSLPPPKPPKKPALRSSMSQKLRSKLEPKGLQLPPQEPATPAVTTAKQFLAMVDGQEEQQGQQATGGAPPGF